MTFARCAGTFRLLPLVLIVLLAGCETAPPRPAPAEYADTTARELAAQGLHQAAAAEYLRIADIAPSPDGEDYRLAAADSALAAGDVGLAETTLAHPSLSSGPERVRLRREILLAKARLADDDVPGAIARLRALPFDTMPSYLAEEGREMQATALARGGDTAGAARERVALELLLTEPQRIAANREALWQELSGLTPAALDELRRPAPDTLGGWVELALLRIRHVGDPASLESGLGDWARRFPGHPGGASVVDEIRAESEAANRPARRVALLLPLAGQFAEAAGSIRDGFLAGWYASDPSTRPTVTVYDTSSADVVATHRAAIAAGADFVVGPLRKEEVAKLAAAGAPDVRTLALNTPGDSDRSAHPKLFLFTLSPEGEASQVAERAWLDGRAQAAVLVPDSAWGSRVAESFAARWGQLGGSVVESQRYGEDANALADTVKRLLDVDESEERNRALARVLGGELHHEARRRQDVDLIFLAAFPRQARQLRPQIDFFDASRVPVYATSHVFSGEPNPNADGDVNGIMFGDMPWVLGGGGGATGALRERVLALWPEAGRGFTRFYAFGVDAFSLISRLGRLASRPGEEFAGQTGHLSVYAGHTIRRRLEWAIFDDGVPRSLTTPEG